MNRPNLYETIYAHDRRAHRHRCQCCSKVVNAGEPVVMYAVSKATRVLHTACADRPSFDGLTFRQLAQLQSDEHARKLGYRVPESHSARKGGEKPDGLQSEHRGIPQARSSEGGNGGQALDVSIQSREPVVGNPDSSGAGEHGALDTRSVLTPRHSLTAATIS